MSRVRGLPDDLGNLGIAYFADHDHVRVLAKDGPENGGEPAAGPVVDRDLIDAVNLALDRILDRDDVGPAVSQVVQCAVQDRGLSRSRRAGDEHEAVGPLERPSQQSQTCLVVAERLDAFRLVARIDDPKDDLLAVDRRQR